MAKKVTRRSFLKRSFGTLLATVGLSAGGYLYAREIEPNILKTIHHTFHHPQLPDCFEALKIVQFSDTHLGFQYTMEQLDELVKEINSHQPDVIFFTGDLLDEPNKFSRANDVITILQRLQAPFGKFAVYGNHDHGGYGTRLYRDIMKASNFTLLLNESFRLEKNDDSIYIIGIDDAMLGKPSLQESSTHIPMDSFKILLSHAPDLADDAVAYQIQLQLSGHSHGGQIKLPFFGALVKPPYGEKYYEGFYTIGESDPLTLYVNRGLGTTRLPFRFLSTPELTVFTLKKQIESS